ncbi:hypothetical protein NADFUDRAFT_50726 [Nadsonia fulvescens var. elongata DSM 6958]|uniref:SAGA-associated factor 11 n=1 Tax=Nadsonia fulvescens var. elongata DSM 6958 TaxID=857566 RepID=A0A1E3PN04_9ASCO|nr:hypothetical protein NADFUDRAFT_50726 [Nadsonia fulvescens var. elongata DSM 6958]
MILQDLLSSLTTEVAVECLIEEKQLRQLYGKAAPATVDNLPVTVKGRGSIKANSEVNGRINFFQMSNRDIYGKEKSTEVRYFECVNCARKIAGSRFAAHIERCLGGRTGRNKGVNYNSNLSTSSPNSMGAGSYSTSISSSPAPGLLAADTNTKTKKRRFNRIGSEGPPSKTQVSKFIQKSQSRFSSPIVAERARVC